MNNRLWVIGKPIVDDQELGWELQGVFYSEEQAAANAFENEFIAEVSVGERLPDEAKDAIKLYYPKHETWETSVLYKMRNGGLN
jgi:hypothetical protein